MKLMVWKNAAIAESPQLSMVPDNFRENIIASEMTTVAEKKYFIMLFTGLKDLWDTTANIIPKWQADKNINTIVIMLIAFELNPIIEEFLVLKPPVDTVLNAWFTASKKDIPASIRHMVSRIAMEAYTVQMIPTIFLVL